MLLAIFFITKGLKIITVTKFSLKEVKSLCIWPRLVQLQGSCSHRDVERRRIELDIVAVQCHQLLKLILYMEVEGGVLFQTF